MTLTYYNCNQELFNSCVLHWQGRDQTSLGFPILPAGVTVTPNGSWTDNTTGVTRSVKNFNGTDAYISLGNDTAFDFGLSDADFSLACWVKITANQNCGIFTKHGGVMSWGDSAGLQTILAYYSSGTYFGLSFWNGSTGNVYGASAAVTALNNWVHLVFVGSGATITTYVNGAISNTNTATPRTAHTTRNVNTIGELVGYPMKITGNMKDLMIYKGRALTQSEIIEIMRLTNPASGRDFAAIYPGVRLCE